MPKVYAYLRCSHEDSAIRGNSKSDQESRVKRWIADQMQPGRALADCEMGTVGYERGPNAPGGLDGERIGEKFLLPSQKERERLEKWYTKDRDDGIFVELGESAFKNDFLVRPVGKRLNLALQPGDVIVFAYFDRSFRSVLDYSLTLSYWLRKGVNRICFIDMPGVDFDSPYGQAQLTMAAAFAQLQSQLSSTKIRSIFADRMKRGLKSRNKKRCAPGFRYVPGHGTERAVPVPEEVAQCIAIVEMVNRGMSFSSVAVEMENQTRRKYNEPPITWLGLWRAKYWGEEQTKQGYKQAYRQGWVDGEMPPEMQYKLIEKKRLRRKAVRFLVGDESEQEPSRKKSPPRSTVADR